MPRGRAGVPLHAQLYLQGGFTATHSPPCLRRPSLPLPGLLPVPLDVTAAILTSVGLSAPAVLPPLPQPRPSPSPKPSFSWTFSWPSRPLVPPHPMWVRAPPREIWWQEGERRAGPHGGAPCLGGPPSPLGLGLGLSSQPIRVRVCHALGVLPAQAGEQGERPPGRGGGGPAAASPPLRVRVR